MLPDNLKAQLSAQLAAYKQKVKVLYFTRKTGCDSCAEGFRLTEELARLSSKFIIALHDIEEQSELAESCGVDKVPAYVVLAESGRDYGIRFFGIPSGDEAESFIHALALIAQATEMPDDKALQKIMDISTPVHIKAFITPQSPSCAKVVQTAHLVAYVNDNIRADVIDITAFPDLAKKYDVQSVPKIVMNETIELADADSVEAFLEAINTLQTLT